MDKEPTPKKHIYIYIHLKKKKKKHGCKSLIVEHLESEVGPLGREFLLGDRLPEVRDLAAAKCSGRNPVEICGDFRKQRET